MLAFDADVVVVAAAVDAVVVVITDMLYFWS